MAILLFLIALLGVVSATSAQVVRHETADGRIYFTGLPPVSTPPASRDALCFTMGELAFGAAQARDQGVLASQHLAAMAQIVAPTLFIQTYARTVILNVHIRIWETPAQAQRRVETTCLVAQQR